MIYDRWTLDSADTKQFRGNFCCEQRIAGHAISISSIGQKILLVLHYHHGRRNLRLRHHFLPGSLICPLTRQKDRSRMRVLWGRLALSTPIEAGNQLLKHSASFCSSLGGFSPRGNFLRENIFKKMSNK